MVGIQKGTMKLSQAVANLQRQILDAPLPSRLKFPHFHADFKKIGLNNRLAPPLGLASTSRNPESATDNINVLRGNQNRRRIRSISYGKDTEATTSQIFVIDYRT